MFPSIPSLRSADSESHAPDAEPGKHGGSGKDLEEQDWAAAPQYAKFAKVQGVQRGDFQPATLGKHEHGGRYDPGTAPKIGGMSWTRRGYSADIVPDGFAVLKVLDRLCYDIVCQC